jgi:hypothetical protein
MHAPAGTLATLTGLSGGAHYGFGKGVGGLVGGGLKEFFGSTALAFRSARSLCVRMHVCREIVALKVQSHQILHIILESINLKQYFL